MNFKANAETPSQGTDRLLPDAVVQERTSLDRTTRWRLAKKGQFPAPIQISPGRVAWSESSITAWIAEKVAAVGR